MNVFVKMENWNAQTKFVPKTDIGLNGPIGQIAKPNRVYLDFNGEQGCAWALRMVERYLNVLYLNMVLNIDSKTFPLFQTCDWCLTSVRF